MSAPQSTLWRMLEQFPDLKHSHVPSKYAEKLAENYVPDVAEAEEVGEFASQMSLRTSQISEEMYKLEARINELKLKRANILKVRAPYQALASASRRLPKPVLQRIFFECLSKTRNAVMHTAEAPLLLGRVCSHWRTVAYSTPELWARLHIVPPHTHRDGRNSEKRFLQKRKVVHEWLSRSGECPLHLSFVWFGLASEDVIRLNAILLESLLPLSKRWREIDVQAPMVLLTPFYDLTSEDVPILRTISLMGSRGPDVLWDGGGGCETSGPGVSDVVNLVGRTTQLRDLALAFNISDTLPSTSIPWTQLQVLYLESNVRFFFPDFDEMAKALMHCQKLRSLSLKYPINQTESLPGFKYPGGPITLANLEVLCVDGDQHLKNVFDMAATFSFFITPKLQELAVLGRPPRGGGENSSSNNNKTGASDSYAQDLLTGIRDLLRASKCPLQRLKLESIALKTDVFFECLKLAPQVEELTVYSYFCRAMADVVDGAGGAAEYLEHSLDNELLRLMTPGFASEIVALSASEKGKTIAAAVLCPRLKTFDYTLSDVDEQLFRQFVESRCINVEPGIAKLQSVKTSLTGRETKEVKQWVMDIRKQGTELALLYHSPLVEDVNPSPWSGVAGLA